MHPAERQVRRERLAGEGGPELSCPPSIHLAPTPRASRGQAACECWCHSPVKESRATQTSRVAREGVGAQRRRPTHLGRQGFSALPLVV